MLKTNVLKKTKTITFTVVAAFATEYLNESFEYIEADGTFVDWLNGGIVAPQIIGSFTINDAEYDVEFLNRRFTSTIPAYVQAKLLQKLQIHQSEFSYPYENTEDIGIPYLDKPTKEELDLFIKDAILSTIGVKTISSFASRKAVEDSKYGNARIGYFAEFEVTTVTNETIAQAIVL